MTHRHEEPAARESPAVPTPGDSGGVPRDLPDQQANADGVSPDPWDAERPGERGQRRETEGPETGDPDGARERGDEVPDTDESGTGRRGTPRPGGVHPEQPAPQEPSD